MEKYVTTQVFIIAIAIVLLVTFYLLLAANLMTGDASLITPLVLVVIAVICLIMLSTLTKIEFYMISGKKR